MHYQPGKYSLEKQVITINSKITNTAIVTNLQFNYEVCVCSEFSTCDLCSAIQ